MSTEVLESPLPSAIPPGPLSVASWAVMTEATGSWKQCVYNQLVDRNQTQDRCFRSIAVTYDRILTQYKEVRDRNAVLQKDLAETRKKRAELEEELKILKSNGAVPAVTTTRLKELEEKIYRLQEELTASYRDKAENVKTILDRTQEHDRMQSQLNEMKKLLEDNQLEKKSLEEALRLLQIEYDKQNSTLLTMQKEMEAMQKEQKKREEKMREMTVENKQLLDRFLEQKQKEVEAMNQVNELYGHLKRAKDELELTRRELEQVRRALPQDGNLASLALSPDELKHALTEAAVPKGIARETMNDAELNTVAWDITGGSIGTGGNDKLVRIWDPRTLSCTSSLHGPQQSVMSVAFSPNGEMVMGGSNDGSTRVFSIALGRVKHALTGHTGKIYGTAFSSDSKKAITGSHDRTIKFWDLIRGSCLKTSVCFSSCNDLGAMDDMAVSGHFDSTLRFWDIRTGNMTEEIQEAHQQQITSVTISSDGLSVLSNSRDNALKLWDVRKYEAVQLFRHDGYKNSVNWNRACLSPENRFAVAGSATGVVYLWNVRTQQVEAELKGHKKEVCCCSWSPTGMFLATVGNDKKLILWK